MKPILPSRPNHSWLRRRFRDAMRGILLGSAEGSDAAARWSSGQANSGGAMLGGMPKSSFAAWAATFLALSCNAYASLTVAPGSQSQSARLLTALPNEIAFCVKDASGQPVQGAQVALALSGPTGPHGEAGLQGLSGTLFAGSSCFTSDPYPVYGELPGSYILHATSSYGSADVTVNIVDGARPDHIALLGGTPTAAAGTAFQPFRVQVFDTD